MRPRSSMVVKEDCQFIRIFFFRNVLFEDVITLFGIKQDQYVHGQCVFELFQNTSVSECQAIAVV
jgi:hypothetical protein